MRFSAIIYFMIAGRLVKRPHFKYPIIYKNQTMWIVKENEIIKYEPTIEDVEAFDWEVVS